MYLRFNQLNDPHDPQTIENPDFVRLSAWVIWSLTHDPQSTHMTHNYVSNLFT